MCRRYKCTVKLKWLNELKIMTSTEVKKSVSGKCKWKITFTSASIDVILLCGTIILKKIKTQLPFNGHEFMAKKKASMFLVKV